MGAMQRRKGHGYEREIAIKFRELYPGAKRKLEYQMDECTGVDLEGVGPFLIQCKRLRKYASISKIKEVEGRGIHALVTRGDNERDVICLYLADFLKILKLAKRKSA
jgi:hypothetical protein